MYKVETPHIVSVAFPYSLYNPYENNGLVRVYIEVITQVVVIYDGWIFLQVCILSSPQDETKYKDK